MSDVAWADPPAAPETIDNERGYGQEAIEIMLQMMANIRNLPVEILAAYAARMGIVFRSNPGMPHV